MKVLRLPLVLASALAAPLTLDAQETLKAAGTDWEFLLYKTGGATPTPIAPDSFDPDFYTTWFDQTALGYDGPSFITGTGYFGYGPIDGAVITTNIWNPDGSLPTTDPPSGSRYTTYFVTTVTPTQPVTNLRFTGIIDDGAIIYVNGAELTRINMDMMPDTWTLLSAINGDESNPVSAVEAIALPANVPIRIGVSVHNGGNASSDMGFDFTIESVAATVPGNDDFANAVPMAGTIPITATGYSGDGIGGAGATKEAGEPDHAGDTGGASIWYSYTPVGAGRVSISTAGSDFNTLLAVYTGSAVNALTPVSQYANMSFPAASADHPFWAASYVEFDAEAGTTYYIAVDGAGGDFGTADLTIDANFTFLDPLAELLPARSDWEYLLAVDGTNQPIDPGAVDLDFDTTWHTAASYDGPTFSGPAPALLGYGVINNHAIVTNLWGGLDHNGDLVPDNEPPTGLRYTTYFRTTFTPTEFVDNVGFEGLIDDGSIIYFNGVEMARINVADTKDSDNWQTLADSANHAFLGTTGLNNEDRPQTAFVLEVDLPASVPVEVAVSHHNASITSSDMGFDLRIWSVNPPPDPPASEPINLFITATAPGEYEVSWNSEPNETYAVDFSVDLQTWFIIGTGIAADPSGTTSIPDIPLPGDDPGFYRVREE